MKQKAVFLDRDGTLIEYEPHVLQKQNVRLFPFAGEAIKRLNKLGFLVIVVTNQPVIEKGEITRDEYNVLNEYMITELTKTGARIDRIYTCPHRFVPGREDLCRKPNTGLIEEAQKDFQIDMSRSWLIGDTLRDIETARRAGIQSILVQTGGSHESEDLLFLQTKKDLVAMNILEAVSIIIGTKL